MRKAFILYLLLTICWFNTYSQRSRAIAPENKIASYVTDKSNTLSSDQISTLNSKLVNFEKETSNQVVVYIISSLDGESLEDKSHDIAEQNGVGQKSKNNGVLLFIAMNDHKLRIEVGYGLEGALPDILCDQIIRKEITPLFKQNKYYEGINAGVDAIIKATKGEYTADKKQSGQEFSVGVCGLPLFIFLIFGFIGFWIVFLIIRRIFGGRRIGGGGGWWNTGGWSSGSGSSWSSGSSFGGFSGGGGSFGGGGASGSW